MCLALGQKLEIAIKPPTDIWTFLTVAVLDDTLTEHKVR